jgi:hypothetical protein
MLRRSMLAVTVLAAGTLAVAAGCASSASKPEDDPTTRALGDPMNYSPNKEDDISGGGISDFHGDAFKKDMDHVLNP